MTTKKLFPAIIISGADTSIDKQHPCATPLAGGDQGK